MKQDLTNVWLNAIIAILFLCIIFIIITYSTRPMTSTGKDANFGSVEDVIAAKVKNQASKGQVYQQTVYHYQEDPIATTARTRNNKINIDALAVENQNDIYITVNNDSLFVQLLKQDNIPYETYDALVVSGIKPVPGGLNRLLQAINQDIRFLMFDELGNIVIIPRQNVTRLIPTVQGLFTAEDVNFGNIQNVIQQKVDAQSKLGKIYNVDILTLKYPLLDLTAITRQNNINIESVLYNNFNNQQSVKIVVNDPEKLRGLLTETTNVTKGVVLSGIYPIPGGYNKTLLSATSIMQWIFIDELGNLIMVPVNPDETDIVYQRLNMIA